ncbi:MAG: hypothetical protein QW711_07220 [Candidatus Korarchaeum sp.]
MEDALRTIYSEDVSREDGLWGDEYSLLMLGDEEVKISGLNNRDSWEKAPVIDRMTNCGYTMKLMREMNTYIAAYLFDRVKLCASF